MLRSLLIALAAIASSYAAPLKAGTNPTLDDITPAVGGGTFKQITSVIVARGERVLYEQYFGASGRSLMLPAGAIPASARGMSRPTENRALDSWR